ncbi:molybdenum ABC transporter ATP-binding protein [Orrella marina]|nr:molybdenum ABC transporter ATP-binding protein [Orrella marina]
MSEQSRVIAPLRSTMKQNLALKLQLDRKDFRLQVDLSLPATGVTVLFGPSGSGKTTVLRCVAGLERGRGRVLIGDEAWQDSDRGAWLPTWARDLGYVFQEASLFEHMDVQANLRFGLQRTKTASGQQALDAAVEMLGIGHLLKRKPQSLSGGERQRVAIARALATQPRILLLDEPLASLDVVRRQELLPWLERMHLALQIPVLYVTHSMEELTRLADHVVLMEGGQVRIEGPVSQVLSDPQFAAAVGGEAGTVLTGIIKSHDDAFHLTCVDLHGSEIWVRKRDARIGTVVRLHIHANDVSLATSEPRDTSIQNILRGVVDVIDDDSHPASCLVRIRHADQCLIARVTRKAVASLKLEAQVSVWVQIKSVALSER